MDAPYDARRRMIFSAENDRHPAISQGDEQVVAVTQTVGIADQRGDIVKWHGAHNFSGVGDRKKPPIDR